MKLKQRVGDFRVRELLGEGVLQRSGDHRVYRVTKRKLTTPEAVRVLAEEAGVEASSIGYAGWKDRQAISTQYFSVPRGREVRVQGKEIRIEPAGFSHEPLSSEGSRGNAFELTVRALEGRDLRRLRLALPVVREHGLVNYFDDQRFGNLTHGQGWIAKELMLGRFEEALRDLLTAPSPRDDGRHQRFKRDVSRAWGDWRTCRDAAGRFGAHHSVFEHLNKNPGDFAGAFTFVASRTRLIHLFAWQSHLWNRAVTRLVRARVPAEERVLMHGLEGVLLGYRDAPPAALVNRSFRLPGEGLDDVADEEELGLLEDVLAEERMVPDQLRIEGVSGFRLKGEDRPLLVRPEHLRVRPAESDSLNRGTRLVRLRFELPRGAYASLVVKRLFAGRTREPEGDPPGDDRRRRRGDAGRQTRGRDSRAGRGGRGGRERRPGSDGPDRRRGKDRDPRNRQRRPG